MVPSLGRAVDFEAHRLGDYRFEALFGAVRIDLGAVELFHELRFAPLHPLSDSLPDLFDRLTDLFQRFGQGLSFPLVTVAFLGRGQNPRPLLHAGERRLEAIVIRLRDRIEFVIVAPGATHRQSQERRSRSVDHIVDGIGPNLQGRRRILIPDIVVSAAHQKSGADLDLRLVRPQPVARQMFPNETIVGFVAVQGIDHVVPKVPRVVSDHVPLVTVALAEPDDVQPMPAPSFAVARRSQITVDQALPGAGARIREKLRDFFRFGRKAVKHEGEPADQGALVGHRGRRQLPLGQLLHDERIDAVANAGTKAGLDGRRRRAGKRLQRPPSQIGSGGGLKFQLLRPLGALLDPSPKQSDLFRRQRRAFPGHFRSLSQRRRAHHLYQQAAVRVRGYHHVLRRLGTGQVGKRYQRKPAFGSFPVMAGQAVTGKNGSDLRGEIHPIARRGGPEHGTRARQQTQEKEPRRSEPTNQMRNPRD